MVLLEHMGFGARDRQLWMYYWDERDGPDFTGWWITPDYIGNNDFILHSSTNAALPTECGTGSWRSPMVEQQQLKRNLSVGFDPVKEGAPDCVACGMDAGTAFVPDGRLRIDLSRLVWKPDGMNHGRPAYQAYMAEAPTEAQAEESNSAPVAVHPVVYMLAGIAIGGLFAAAMLRRSR